MPCAIHRSTYKGSTRSNSRPDHSNRESELSTPTVTRPIFRRAAATPSCNADTRWRCPVRSTRSSPTTETALRAIGSARARWRRRWWNRRIGDAAETDSGRAFVARGETEDFLVLVDL